MQEIRECVICHKKFVATRWKMIVCTNEECRRVHRAEVKQAYRDSNKDKPKSRRRKSDKSLNDFANEATRQGITYGKKQAEEYAEQVRISKIPSGYTRIGDRRKN